MQLTSGGLLAGASRPPSSSRRLQLILVLSGPKLKLLLVALVAALPGCSGSWLYTPDRPPEKILLPDGFVGWTRLDYGVEGAPPLARDGEYVVIRYPEQGHVSTS